jgi:NADH:ubiquinone oxidoreductase subunit 5 (subunit L)/multisubunit Na+/H+ antiporter MnhA subunit
MVNNAIYKSSLFLMAGSVEDETGTAELDKLGGLARQLPMTFVCGVVAALAISGIPPLNGFVSKWFVYQGVLERAAGHPAVIIFLIVAVFGSALTLASFVKVLHSVFMGPRPAELLLSGRGRTAWRWLPMAVLALLCLGLGIFAGRFLDAWLLPATASLGVNVEAIRTGGNAIVTDVGCWSATTGTGLILLGIVLGLLLYWITQALKVRVTPTFVGGEALRTARFGGGGFYKTIRDLPLLRGLFGDAEAGAFDGYHWFGQAGQLVVDMLRSWHAGLLPVYVAWALFGLLAAVLWLLIA